jgi:hypothetical protein
LMKRQWEEEGWMRPPSMAEAIGTRR